MLKLLVIGNLGKDATTNTTQAGQSVINFSVAHTEKYVDKQGNKAQKTTWVECSWWTDKHAIVPYLTKGTQVYVEGAPEAKSYTRNDGTTGTSLGLRVINVQMLGSPSNSNGQPQANTQSAPQSNSNFQQQAPQPLNTSDDLPF